jgi:hypothetical protein
VDPRQTREPHQPGADAAAELNYTVRRMRHRFRVFAFTAFILLLTASDLQAQTVTDERVWFSLPVQGHIGSDESPWRWSMELILRSREGLDDLDTATVRPSLFYDFSSRASVGGGYANSTLLPAVGENITEHRLYGQFTWNQPGAFGTLSLRTRLEDRFIENNDGPIGRLRQQFRFSHPLHKGGRLALVGADEILFHLNDTSRLAKGVEQNRLFAGISHALTPLMRIEIGYLNQYYPGHRDANSRMNHVLSTSLGMAF